MQALILRPALEKDTRLHWPWVTAESKKREVSAIARHLAALVLSGGWVIHVHVPGARCSKAGRQWRVGQADVAKPNDTSRL